MTTTRKILVRTSFLLQFYIREKFLLISLCIFVLVSVLFVTPYCGVGP